MRGSQMVGVECMSEFCFKVRRRWEVYCNPMVVSMALESVGGSSGMDQVVRTRKLGMRVEGRFLHPLGMFAPGEARSGHSPRYNGI
jgi:hypothetical protein